MNLKDIMSRIKALDIQGNFTRMLRTFAGDVDSKTGSLVLAVIIVVLLNVAGSFLYFRLDITANNSYSLSDISKKVVSGLEEPLTIKVFFSEDLPAPHNATYRYIVDLMEEYNLAGNRYFHYQFVDMDDEKNKTEAAGYGINPVPLREIGSDQFKVRNSYMGLAIIHGDLIEKITDLTTADGIEYRITNAIQKMVSKNDALLKLNNRIRVTLYVSRDLSNFNIQGFDTVDQSVKKIVDKVSTVNYGKLDYNAKDPTAEKTTADLVKKYGLQSIAWKDTHLPTGKNIVAGEGLMTIIIELGDRFQVVPLNIGQNMFGYVIAGLDTLEDRLNNSVGMLLSHNPVVAYATGHGEKNLSDEREGAANLKKVLSGMYEVNEVDLTKDAVPHNVKTLIINGPKTRFTDEELYRIDQFIVGGGNALFMVDSFNEMRMQSDNPFAQSAFLPVETGLEKLFSSWGVSINKDYVLDTHCFIQRQGTANGDQAIYFVPKIERRSLNHKNPVTRSMKEIYFIKASSLSMNNDAIKGAGLKSEPLISSSDKSWKMQGQINLSPFMLQPPQEAKQYARFDLAVMVSGKFKSVFNGTAPISVDPKKATQEKVAGTLSVQQGLTQSAHEGNIVIIGTSEVAGAQAIDPDGKSPNAVFISNIVDVLNGNINTPDMRSKGIEFNPIETTSEWTRFAIKLINMLLLPIFAILAGIFMWRLRIRRKKSIKDIFAKGVSHE